MFHSNHSNIVVSTQVLNEASNVWLKKYGLDIHQVKSYLKIIRKSAEVRLLNETLTFRALELFGRHKLSFHDSLIIAAALDAGCRTLYTEDLQHGQRIEKLTSRIHSAMKTHEILNLLKRHKPILTQRFDLVDLALFGSSARGESGPGSDIDVLVAFAEPATSKRYFGVQFYLEDLLGRPVDLVTGKALRPEIRPFVEREAIHV